MMTRKIENIRYQCEFCLLIYSSEDSAIECEKNHEFRKICKHETATYDLDGGEYSCYLNRTCTKCGFEGCVEIPDNNELLDQVWKLIERSKNDD